MIWFWGNVKTAILTIMEWRPFRDNLCVGFTSSLLVAPIFISNALFFKTNTYITWKFQIEVWVFKVSLEKWDLTIPGSLCSWIASVLWTWSILSPGSHRLRVTFAHSCYLFGTLWVCNLSLKAAFSKYIFRHSLVVK